MNIRRSAGRRFLAGALSLIYVSVHVVFAHAAESNLWAERRRSAASADALAAVPATAGDPLTVLKGLPDLRPDALSPSALSHLEAGLPKGSLDQYVDLLKSIPSAQGTVRRVSLSAGRGPTVVFLQDVHNNDEAQQNLGGIVSSLATAGKVSLVALEAEFAPLNLDKYRAFENQAAVRMTADHLLKEHQISGPVHTAYTHPGALPPFVGVDDPARYQANIDAYRRSAPKMDGAKHDVAVRFRHLREEKERVFNPALLAFDRAVEDHHREGLSFGDYVSLLSSQDKPAVSGQIELFLQALAMEKFLDFASVEKERSRLIEDLVRRLSKSQLDRLLRFSVAYRTGGLAHTDYYRALKDFCRENGVALASYPAMDRYIQYVLLSGRINADALFRDVRAAEKAVYARLAKTDDEKRLAAASRRLTLTGKLLDFSLTPDEWTEYSTTPSFPNGSIGNPGQTDLSSFESFYREADARNHAMTENLLKALAGKKDGAAVLVAGGFHTAGMTRLLIERGVSVIEVAPKLTRMDGPASAYLGVFTQEKTPLEQIFKGNKLFVGDRANRAALGHRVDMELSMAEAHMTGNPAKAVETYRRFDGGSKDDLANVAIDGNTVSAEAASPSGRVGLKLTVVGGAIAAFTMVLVVGPRVRLLSAVVWALRQGVRFSSVFAVLSNAMTAGIPYISGFSLAVLSGALFHRRKTFSGRSSLGVGSITLIGSMVLGSAAAMSLGGWATVLLTVPAGLLVFRSFVNPAQKVRMVSMFLGIERGAQRAWGQGRWIRALGLILTAGALFIACGDPAPSTGSPASAGSAGMVEDGGEGGTRTGASGAVGVAGSVVNDGGAGAGTAGAPEGGRPADGKGGMAAAGDMGVDGGAGGDSGGSAGAVNGEAGGAPVEGGSGGSAGAVNGGTGGASLEGGNGGSAGTVNGGTGGASAGGMAGTVGTSAGQGGMGGTPAVVADLPLAATSVVLNLQGPGATDLSLYTDFSPLLDMSGSYWKVRLKLTPAAGFSVDPAASVQLFGQDRDAATPYTWQDTPPFQILVSQDPPGVEEVDGSFILEARFRPYGGGDFHPEKVGRVGIKFSLSPAADAQTQLKGTAEVLSSQLVSDDDAGLPPGDVRPLLLPGGAVSADPSLQPLPSKDQMVRGFSGYEAGYGLVSRDVIDLVAMENLFIAMKQNGQTEYRYMPLLDVRGGLVIHAQNMDAFLALAQKHGITLILTLVDAAVLNPFLHGVATDILPDGNGFKPGPEMTAFLDGVAPFLQKYGLAESGGKTVMWDLVNERGRMPLLSGQSPVTPGQWQFFIRRLLERLPAGASVTLGDKAQTEAETSFFLQDIPGANAWLGWHRYPFAGEPFSPANRLNVSRGPVMETEIDPGNMTALFQEAYTTGVRTVLVWRDDRFPVTPAQAAAAFDAAVTAALVPSTRFRAWSPFPVGMLGLLAAAVPHDGSRQAGMTHDELFSLVKACSVPTGAGERPGLAVVLDRAGDFDVDPDGLLMVEAAVSRTLARAPSAVLDELPRLQVYYRRWGLEDRYNALAQEAAEANAHFIARQKPDSKAPATGFSSGRWWTPWGMKDWNAYKPRAPLSLTPAEESVAPSRTSDLYEESHPEWLFLFGGLSAIALGALSWLAIHAFRRRSSPDVEDEGPGVVPVVETPAVDKAPLIVPVVEAPAAVSVIAVPAYSSVDSFLDVGRLAGVLRAFGRSKKGEVMDWAQMKAAIQETEADLDAGQRLTPRTALLWLAVLRIAVDMAYDADEIDMVFSKETNDRLLRDAEIYGPTLSKGQDDFLAWMKDVGLEEEARKTLSHVRHLSSKPPPAAPGTLLVLLAGGAATLWSPAADAKPAAAAQAVFSSPGVPWESLLGAAALAGLLVLAAVKAKPFIKNAVEKLQDAGARRRGLPSGRDMAASLAEALTAEGAPARSLDLDRADGKSSQSVLRLAAAHAFWYRISAGFRADFPGALRRFGAEAPDMPARGDRAGATRLVVRAVGEQSLSALTSQAGKSFLAWAVIQGPKGLEAFKQKVLSAHAGGTGRLLVFAHTSVERAAVENALAEAGVKATLDFRASVGIPAEGKEQEVMESTFLRAAEKWLPAAGADLGVQAGGVAVYAAYPSDMNLVLDADPGPVIASWNVERIRFALSGLFKVQYMNLKGLVDLVRLVAQMA